MDDKTFLQRSATAFDMSVMAGGASTIDGLRRYAAMSAASQMDILGAAMRPAEAWRHHLEAALDISRSVRTAMERSWLADLHASTMRLSESSALEQFKRHAETSSLTSRLASMGDPMVARSKAIEALLSPSAMAARYLAEMTGTAALTLASERAARWHNSYESLAGALERFQEPITLSTAHTLLERFAKASDTFGPRGLLIDAAERVESERTHAEIAHLLDGVNTEISQALTLEDAFDQIVQAIKDTREPLHRQLLSAFFVAFFVAIVFAFINPVVDFYVKKWLEGAPKQQATKQVKEAARNAVGDSRVLNDYRFVDAQTLTLKSAPKARAPVVAQLRFGQAVRVLEKNRDFTLVACRVEDGETELQGWVFSRYLRRFD